MLYLGIDIGKSRHLAALLSSDLLARHGVYSACPVIAVSNDRAGFERLLTAIRNQTDPQETHVLMERTGHYGQALETYLHEQGCTLYRMQARNRYSNNKTDQQDARALAVLLYNEVALHAPVVDEKLRITPLVAPSPLARTLRGLVRHRYELVSESTQRKNKLTAISDELFPELKTAYHGLFSESALALREQFPTPELVASASLDELCATRKRNQPSRDQLALLQASARATIGTRDRSRQESLLIEQRQLLAELHLMARHIEQLDSEIEQRVASSRDGQILLSFPGIASTQAAILLAGIGSIANFESEAKLRGYLGWSPRATQTGTSQDASTLSKGGNTLLKRSLYLVVMTAIRTDAGWKARYSRMVARKCRYDGRREQYLGKMKVVGHIAGHLIRVIYVLLRKDYDLLMSLPDGAVPPSPELYDPALIARVGREKAGERTH